MSGYDPASSEDYYTAFACLREDGRTRRLGAHYGSAQVFSGPYAFTVGGRFVGFDDSICNHGECQGRFHVIDVRSGKVRRSASINAADAAVTDDVVTSRGAAAWIRQNNTGEVFEVRALPSSSRGRRLARGSNIDPLSLEYRYATRRVYWRDADQIRSARLK